MLTRKDAETMSVVIIGGHERMEHRYQKICEEYGCTAKVYTKEKGAMKKKIGSPDLLICFTTTVYIKWYIPPPKRQREAAFQLHIVTVAAGRL